MNETDFRERQLTSRMVYDGRIIKVYYDTVRLANGVESFREVVRHPGAVAVVPVAADSRVVLVRQFRYPAGRAMWEIPAGKLDHADEEPEECARRELLEETGISCRRLTLLTSLLTTPGFCDEIIHIYRAGDLVFGQAEPDLDEVLAAKMFTPEEITEMVNAGEIADAKTIVGLALAGVYRQECQLSPRRPGMGASNKSQT
ncbi:MAG: NUDIX hydrolase [Negativicutes bacterium]|nr:NUDIX hydrolase [Negativicutes bacterium]